MAKIISVHLTENLIRKLKSVCKPLPPSYFVSYPYATSLPSFISLTVSSRVLLRSERSEWADGIEPEIQIRNHPEDYRYYIIILIGFPRLRIWGDWRLCLLPGEYIFHTSPPLGVEPTTGLIPKKREIELIDSLMCFVDAAQDRANPSSTPSSVPTKPVPHFPAAVAPAPPPKVITSDDFEDVRLPDPLIVQKELMNRNRTLMKFW